MNAENKRLVLEIERKILANIVPVIRCLCNFEGA